MRRTLLLAGLMLATALVVAPVTVAIDMHTVPPPDICIDDSGIWMGPGCQGILSCPPVKGNSHYCKGRF